MTTYNTGNPLGSTDPRDLYDNAQTFDQFAAGPDLAYIDRFGKVRKSLAGMEYDFQQFLLNSGYVFLGDYDADGPLTLTARNQVFTKDGEYWRAKASLVLPYMTINNWATDQANFVSVGDAVLRQEIGDVLSPLNGAGMVGRAAQIVGSITALRALDKTAVSKHAFVTGYYVPGDGGGGPYYYDAADVSSADNGGTVIVASDGGRWKLQYLDRVSLDQFGAKGSNSGADAPTNDITIQKAFDSGVPLFAPDGVYQLSLSRNITLEAGATVCSLIIPSGLNMIGNGWGRSVIKLRDGESTDANPKFFNLMASNQALSNIYLDNITFDINGQNNKISPNRGSGVYNPYNCAAFMVSGSVATGGADARVSNSKLLRLEVINSPGVTCIALGQRFSHSGVKGENVEIAGCRFYNNGNDSADHSSIYAFGNGVNVHGNVFDFPTPSTGKGGPVCCVELFGSFMQMHNNRVRNYLQLAWVGQGEEGQHHHIMISNNIGTVNYRGVDFWALTPQDDGMADVTICNNDITITADPLGTPGLDRVAVNMAPVNGDVFRTKIFGNKFVCLDRSANAGIVLSPTATHSLQDIDIHGNSISGFSRSIAGGGAGSLLSIAIAENDLEDCAATTARPVETRGIDISGTNSFATFNISNNKVSSGDLGALPKIGISLSGAMASLHFDGNGVRASTTEIDDLATVSGRRSGTQGVTFGSLPSQSTWRIGDVAYSATRPFAGAPGSVYTLDGWSRITNGTGNVLNADWVERRIPTGT